MFKIDKMVDDNSNPYKLLIIDDDQLHNDTMADLLEDHYSVEFATNSVDALDKANCYQPDLILLDIMLPDISGFELCEKLKSNDSLKSIPVIFLTAKMSIADKVRGFEVGGADYITKPFEMEEIVARVDTHLNLQRALQTIHHYNQNLEQILEQRTRELIVAEKHSAFSLMIKGIIHNLCSPLTGVSMSYETTTSKLSELADRVRELGINDLEIDNAISEMQSHFELGSKCCENMTDIINVLITKTQYGRQASREVIDLNAILKNEIDFMDSSVKFKHQTEKAICFSENDLPVKALPADISQVFHNLINNAIDALEGTVNPRITICSGQTGNHNWFSIQDNGPGIEAKNLDKIFDPFFSTKETATDSPGLGLGLYTCADIANSYSGRLDVENLPEGGCKFTFSIPAYEF